MEQSGFLRHTADSLDEMGVPYLVVGSIASSAYGESRFTQDIDIVAEFKPHHVAAILAAFPSSEFFVSETAIRDAIRMAFQFNVIHPASGNKIDFILCLQSRRIGIGKLTAIGQNRRSLPHTMPLTEKTSKGAS